MKRILLALLLTTSLLPAKHLYMGHFTGCSMVNASPTQNLAPYDLKNIKQFITHNFQLTAGNSWIFDKKNDFFTFHWYFDHNQQFAAFIDVIMDKESEWQEFEKMLTYLLTPSNISRKVIELK